MRIEYIRYGLYGLLILNILSFIILLFRKILINKYKIQDEIDRNNYIELIKAYLENKIEKITKPNTTRKMMIFRAVILEEFDITNKDQREKLLDIARYIGLVNEEIKHLRNSQETRKAIAAYFLGEIRAKEATKDILANIDTTNKEFLYVICRALVQISGTTYLDIIINILEKSDFSMKPRALDLISLIEDEDIFPKMQEYLEGTSLLKSTVAFESLGIKGDARVIPYIERAIRSNNKELRISALKAVMGINCSEYGKLLSIMSILKDDTEWEVRAFFAKVLCNCNDYCDEKVIILKKMMEDTNWYVRYNSSEGLLKFGEAGVVALSDMLYSEDSFARDRAWCVLQREITLYNFLESIKDYDSYDYILNNITNYENSTKDGALNES